MTSAVAADTPDISKRVRQLATRHGQSLKDMAAHVGFDYDDFQNAIRGRSAKGQAVAVREIRAVYGVPNGWPDEETTDLASTRLVEVPLVGMASGGPGDASDDQGAVPVPATMVLPDSRGWIATGDSMMPWIEPGDVIVARPSKVPEINRVMLVRMPDGDVRVKIVVYKDGEFWLRSLNPRYKDEPAKVEIIGRVTGRYRLKGTHESIENDPVNGIAPTIL